MSVDLKNQITLIQIQFLKAIKSHQTCYEKLMEEGDSIEVNEELQVLQTLIRECQDRQKALLDQIKKENGEVIQFNLYKIPATREKGKKRRRKDFSFHTKPPEKKRSPTPLKSRSPTPTPCSISSNSPPSSEDSDSDDHEMSSMPIPLPMARSKLAGDKSNLPISKYARSAKHESRRSKLLRETRAAALKASDEELFRLIPNIPEPPPSPEPATEHERKIKFMAIFNLVPTELLPDLLIRKKERKRRSTANAQYVYSDDWDYPMKRKNKTQYLSPVKPKLSMIPSKEVETPCEPEKKKVTSDKCKINSDSKKAEPSVTSSDSGLTVTSGDSAQSSGVVLTPDDANKSPAEDELSEILKPPPLVEGSNSSRAAKGVVANGSSSSGLDASECPHCNDIVKRLECTECGELFHARCSMLPMTEQSYIYCRDCRREKKEREDDGPSKSNSNSCSGIMMERLKVRENMLKLLRGKMEEKLKLEKKVLQLADSLALQTKLKKEMMLDNEILIDKIEKIQNVVILYQKTSRKKCSSLDGGIVDKETASHDAVGNEKSVMICRISDPDPELVDLASGEEDGEKEPEVMVVTSSDERDIKMFESSCDIDEDDIVVLDNAMELLDSTSDTALQTAIAPPNGTDSSDVYHLPLLDIADDEPEKSLGL